MALTLPVEILAEYRGVAREWDAYTHRETGEVRDGGRSYKFEFQTSSGLVADLIVSAASVDRACSFDFAGVKRGEQLLLRGDACEGQRGMYFRATEITRAKAAA